MKKGIIIINLILSLFLFSACLPSNTDESTGIRKGLFINTMNTVVEGYVYVEKEEDFDIIFNDILEIFNSYDVLTDNFKKQAQGINGVYYINEQVELSENGATIKIDKKLYNLLSFGLTITEETNGYFDMTIGKIIDVWKALIKDYPTGSVIDNETIEATKNKAQAIPVIEDPINLFTENNEYFITMKKGAKLDLGAIAKGYAVERVKEYLVTKGIKKYNISGGTSSIIVGQDNPVRENGVYIIGLVNPVNQSTYFGTVKLKNENITTSGSYSQYVTDEDGYWYHHIISPKTKMPSHNYYTLGLIGQDAGLLDGYSTALFSMPLDMVKEFLKNKDVEAVIYKLDNEVERINPTDRFDWWT